MSEQEINYEDDLNAIKSSYECNMNTFKEYYTLTKMYPNDESYADTYNTSRSNLIKLSKNLFLMNNLIQKDIDDLKNNSTDVNRNIEENESKKSGLVSHLNFITGEVNGAVQMSQDYKLLYTQQYMSNISMIIGIIASFSATYYVFRKID